MSTDFNVEKGDYKGGYIMKAPTVAAMKADIGLVGNAKLVFALVVVARGNDAEIYALAGEPGRGTKPALGIANTTWEPDPSSSGHASTQRHPMKRQGNPQDPATNALVYPSEDDLLIVTYPQ